MRSLCLNSSSTSDLSSGSMLALWKPTPGAGGGVTPKQEMIQGLHSGVLVLRLGVHSQARSAVEPSGAN